MSAAAASVVLMVIDLSLSVSGIRPPREEGVAEESAFLDDAQRAVLERPLDASFAVIGAPGSGKTTTLIEFVADRVLRAGVPVQSLLVLTPTRQTATRLRDRLALRLRIATGGPLARTATSAAFEAVRAAHVRDAHPPALLTGADQDRIVAELIEGAIDDAEAGRPAIDWPDALTPDVRRLRAFRTELRELMMRATENGVGPDALERLGRDLDVPEWRAAAAFIRDYQRVLDGYAIEHLDSAELLAEARRAVRDGGALQGIRLVVVDDFHDLPVGALNLVRELARGGAAVVAFGDPDVAAAGFRGADVRALGQLSRALGASTEPPLHLRTSHRQRGALRALTRSATERVGTAAAGPQRDTREASDEPAASGEPVASGEPAASGEPVVVAIRADSRAGEIATVAHALREQYLLHGVDWSRMAVVVRSGALVPAFARGLALAEVPTRTLSAVQALRDDYAARHLAEAVALAIGRIDATPDAVSALVLGPLCGVDPVGLRRLRLALRHEEFVHGGSRHSDELLREALMRPGVLTVIDSAPARRVASLATTLQTVRSRAAGGASIEELLWELWQRSGLAKRWGDAAAGSGILADEADRNLDGAVALFTAAKRFVERQPDHPADLFLDEFFHAEVPEDTLSPRSRGGSVLVTTPTGVVGIETDVVVVAALQESVWPDLRLRGSLLHSQRFTAVMDADPSDIPAARAADVAGPSASRAEVLADELRMFALAVSRSRRMTILSCVANDDEQPSAFFGLAPEAVQMPQSRHPLSLRGLTGTLRRQLVEEGDLRAADALARLAAAGVRGADPAEWYGLLAPSTTEPVVDLVDPEATVSVSPSRIQTFEESPLVWFIDRVAGGGKSVAAGVGTIVHAVMEEATTADEPDLSPEALWRAAEKRWGELRFEAPWIQERERRALVAKLGGLADYLERFERAEGQLVSAEARFELAHGQARMNGSIDRVERLADGRILVIDLKTGSTVTSRAKMAGHAQLASYQLALARRSVEGMGDDVDSGDTDAGGRRAELGGAALLFVSRGTGGLRFTLVNQDPLDDAAIAEIEGRIESAAEGMAGSTFAAAAHPEEFDTQSRPEYRIQLVKAISE
jgi:superfamily I DNA/RNA helicase/RecB family exonuclease